MPVLWILANMVVIWYNYFITYVGGKHYMETTKSNDKKNTSQTTTRNHTFSLKANKNDNSMRPVPQNKNNSNRGE